MTLAELQAGAIHPVSPLSDPATSALRCWLQAQRQAQAAGAEAGPAECREAMRLVCAAAHVRGARVEQLIVLIKQLWATLPPVAAGDGWPHPDADRDLLGRIVRACIEEFYAPTRSPTPRPE